MAKKSTSKKSGISVIYSGPSMAEVVRHTHVEKVRCCNYCGRPMSRSDVNDYGSLCETCYMKEYYGEDYVY